MMTSAKTLSADDELSICLWLDERVTYSGPAAALLGEGLIPAAIEWPAADHVRCWEDSGLRFTLRRTRPPGHAGPKRSWLAADHWALTTEVAGRGCVERQRKKLERRARELRADQHHHTPAGLAEFTERWMRHHQATNDKAFQAFKAKAVGTARPTRQRRGQRPEA